MAKGPFLKKLSYVSRRSCKNYFYIIEIIYTLCGLRAKIVIIPYKTELWSLIVQKKIVKQGNIGPRPNSKMIGKYSEIDEIALHISITVHSSLRFACG